MDQPAPKPKNSVTIPVKKADGTLVNMTLEEFRAYKGQQRMATMNTSSGIDPHALDGIPVMPNQIINPHIEPIEMPKPVASNPVPVSSESSPEHVGQNLPMVEQSLELSSETPTIVGETLKDFQHESIQNSSAEVSESLEPSLPEETQPQAPLNVSSTQGGDFVIPKISAAPTQSFTSPLEEVSDEVNTPHNPVSDANESLASEIVAPIAFLVSEEVEPKLKALVLSRVKEIRTDEQVKENALLAVENGGLGLDETKVTILMHAIEEGMKKKPVASEAPSAKARLNPVVPGISTIDKSALKPVEGLTKPVSKPDAQKILSSLIAEDRIQAEIMTSGSKVQMHDVVARPRSMGPVDEMMNFSLVDFRRLGANPTGCADALIQKFNLLKTESFLLYLNGRTAWFKSPLYIMYLEVLEKSLNMNKSLSVILGREKESLQMEEIKEVVRVSQSLNF